jgi:hypothetical protein
MDTFCMKVVGVFVRFRAATRFNPESGENVRDKVAKIINVWN